MRLERIPFQCRRGWSVGSSGSASAVAVTMIPADGDQDINDDAAVVVGTIVVVGDEEEADAVEKRLLDNVRWFE